MVRSRGQYPVGDYPPLDSKPLLDSVKTGTGTLYLTGLYPLSQGILGL